MNCSNRFNNPRSECRTLRLNGIGMFLLLVPLAAMSVSGCSDRDKNISKILVKVNGAAITRRQLDVELMRASPAQEGDEAATPALRKQALEALIDRAILLKEAKRNKVDRDPIVIQTIERYKVQAIVQAYVESQAGTTVKPSKKNVNEYFNNHPELFAHRKVIDIKQLSIASQDFSSALKTVMDARTSLDQIEEWLIARKVTYVKTTASYVSADLPPEVLSQLKTLGKNRLFVLKDGDRDLLSTLSNLVENPVPKVLANSQIERFLMNKKMQEVAATEIARLRPLAELDYVDQGDNGNPAKELNSVTALNKK